MALTVKIRGDASHLNKVMAQTKVSIRGLGQATKAVGIGMASAGVAIASAAAAVGAFYSKMILVGEAALTSEARLENIVKQMGLFGEGAKVVSDRLSDLADTQARAFGIDNKTIRMTQAKLATFKELLVTADDVGGAFDRATAAAIDMQQAGFGQAEQNAVQLGKALNDPIKGITSLSKSGITFTAQEKEKAKAMVESNRMLEAQDLILTAIETQLKGTAGATADASERMKESYAQLVQEFAKPFAMSITGMPDQLEAIFPSLKEKAATAGNIVSTAFKDAINGDLQGIAEIGMVFGRAIAEGLKFAFKMALVELGQVSSKFLEDINPLRKLGIFKDSERGSDFIGKNKAEYIETSMQDGIDAIMKTLNANFQPVGVTELASRLYGQGIRGNDPGYQGTEMGRMLNVLEKIERKTAPIKF